MKIKILNVLALSTLLLTPLAWSEQYGNIPTEEYVRKSKSGICHTTDSPYYRRLKGYMTYNSMQDCLVSGGRKLGDEEKEASSAATPLPPCDSRQKPAEQ